MATKRAYSAYAITVNTNHKAITAAAEHILKQRVKTFFETQLIQRDLLSSMFTFSPDMSILDHVHLSAAGVERGPKTGFIHGHAVLIFEHHGRLQLRKQGAQAALQTAFRNAVGSRGGYADVQLSSAKLLNYVAKTSADDDKLVAEGMQDSVTI